MTLIDKAEAQSAVRAYLVHESSEIALNVEQIIAALPARGVGVPQNVITQLNVTVGEVGLEMVQDAEDAEFTGERPDLHDYQVSIHYDHAVAILAALAPTDAAQAREAALWEAWNVVWEAKTLLDAKNALHALIGDRT